MNQEELKFGCSSFGEWLVKIRKVKDGITKDARVKTAGHWETGDDTQGGFLVAEEWADGIYEAAALEGAIVRPRARLFNTSSDSLKLTTLIDSNRSTNIFGGITFRWETEAEQKTGITKPALGQIELTAHKLVGGCYVSNELEDDHGAFGQIMNASFGVAIRFEEDYYFLWGNGAGQPLGIMNAGCMIQVTRAAAGALDWADFANMSKRLLPDSWNRAVWLISPSGVESLLNATASAANQATVFDASRMTILNRPIIVTEKCSMMGTQGDVILADFSHYAIADRSIEVAGSRLGAGFDEDETFWRVVLRVDGQPLLQSAITPKLGTDTLSPFVSLTTTS